MEAAKKSRTNLSPLVREWYRVLRGFVEEGSFLLETDAGIHRIKNVKLGRDHNGVPKAFIFTSEKKNIVLFTGPGLALDGQAQNPGGLAADE